MTTSPISGSGFNATAYLNQIKGTPPAPTPAPQQTPPTTTPTSLETLGVPSNVFSMLQSTGPTSAGNELSPLFNITPTNQQAGEYNALLRNNTTGQPIESAVAEANLQAAQTTKQANFMQDLLNGLTAAANAYNNTQQQEAQSALNTSNKGLIA